MTTTLEIIDTAVKIGLGAAITGLGTYLVTRLNHKHDRIKERSKRYFDTLEKTAEQIEDITHTSLRYWALVTEWVRNGNHLLDHRQKELTETQHELFNSFKNLTVAEAKLLLIGENKAANMVRQYGTFLKEFRANYHIRRKDMTVEQLEGESATLIEKRKLLFDELAVSYKRTKDF